jgi:hypothetical protein
MHILKSLRSLKKMKIITFNNESVCKKIMNFIIYKILKYIVQIYNL